MSDTKDSVINRDEQGKFIAGQSGNPAGRPKRKTLTELIHQKLDDTPHAWDTIVRIVIEKVISDKDKDVLKALWQYTDGMPKQAHELSTKDDKPLVILERDELKQRAGDNNPDEPSTKTSSGTKSTT